MARKRKARGRRVDSSASDASSSDEMSTAEASPIRRSSDSVATASEAQRNTRKKKDKGIKQMLKEMKEETSEMRKQMKILSATVKDDTQETRKELKRLTESHNELRRQLVHTTVSSGDDSAAPRYESHPLQLPRYRLVFQCVVNDEIEKGKSIETKDHGKEIHVALLDDQDQIVKTQPFASATVMLVVVNGEFNQHGNQYNWLRKDFERNIKRPQQGNSATVDVNQPIESIVSNCVFKLDRGFQSHTGATILRNSSNKKVKLGVMVVSRIEERVLEGLSNPFFVRGHDRHYDSKRQRFNSIAAPNTSVFSPGPLISEDQTLPSETQEQARILQDQFSHSTMYRASMAQATNCLTIGGEHSPLHRHDHFMDPSTQFNIDHIALPVRLVWDMPNVELRKSCWNLLDQLMPLYSCQPGYYNCCLPTMPLMTERLGFLPFIAKDVMQTTSTHQRKGVLIEPLEPDYEERPLMNRKFYSKYRLRFVNKVCEAYYTWDFIRASDGDFVKVALFDENNTQITSGPLASAFVEVVVLHGDFNVDGQNYWTPEEFSRCVVCREAVNEFPPAIGGHRVLALADGEACLFDAFFRMTSRHARTGKFKLGVVALASAQEERIQEGISEEPFRVTRREFEKALPSGFRSQPTDQELILHYLSKRTASLPCPAPIIAEVDIYKFEPWDLPAKATFGKDEWYFYHRNYYQPNSMRLNRRAGCGYWKSTGAGKPIHSTVTGESVGVKNALVFYKGRPPTGTKSNWIMYEYRLADSTNMSTINTITGSSSRSSTPLQDWVLCKIYKKPGCNPWLPTRPRQHDIKGHDYIWLPGFSSKTDDLKNRTATEEPLEKFPAKAQPQMESKATSAEASGSQFLVPGSEGSRA